ncbi:MAG: hypothetical protein AAF226_00315 [Verrucomicrobiota bacterium]
MPYCPHCAHPIPERSPVADCPNCGRGRVKLCPHEPEAPMVEVSALQLNEQQAGSKKEDWLLLLFLSQTFLLLLVLALVLRGQFFMFLLPAAGILFWGADVLKSILRPRKKRIKKGYIDHLTDVRHSIRSLQSKITELDKLVARQDLMDSERSDQRKRLLTEALNNRRLKLRLAKETDYIIESQRLQDRFGSLVIDLENYNLDNHLEQRVDRFFTDLKFHLSILPAAPLTSVGKDTLRDLEETLGLMKQVMEQIEDRKVLQALDEEGPCEAIPLDRIHSRLSDRSSLNRWEVDSISESIQADEEYSKINTEIRKLRDGISGGLATETFDLDLEEEH